MQLPPPLPPGAGGVSGVPCLDVTPLEVVREIEALGRKAIPVKTDVIRSDEVRAMVEATLFGYRCGIVEA